LVLYHVFQLLGNNEILINDCNKPVLENEESFFFCIIVVTSGISVDPIFGSCAMQKGALLLIFQETCCLHPQGQSEMKMQFM